MKITEPKIVKIEGEKFEYHYFSETKEYRIYYKVDSEGLVSDTRIKKREGVGKFENILVV